MVLPCVFACLQLLTFFFFQNVFMIRRDQQAKACKAVSMDSDNYGSAYVSDVDGLHHQKVAINASDGTAEAIQISNHRKEKVDRDTCERSQHNPSSSSSGHFEAARDGAAKSRNHRKRSSPNSATELRESVTSDYYHLTEPRKHGAKTKQGNCKYYAKHRSPIQVDPKHQSRRLHGGFVLEKNRRSEDDTSPLPDTERHYGHHKQNGRVHDFDSYNEKDISYYKQSERSFNSHRKRSSNYHWKDHKSFGVETDQYLGRNLDERECFIEERMTRMDDELMGRDSYHYETRVDTEDVGPIVYQESRQLKLESSSYLDHEIGAQRKRKGDDLLFRRRMRNDECFLEHPYANDFTREKYEKAVPYNDMDSDYLEYEYDEHLPYIGRELKSPGRIEGRCGSPSIGFDDLWSMEEDDEFWRYRDQRSFSSHSYAETHRANGRMWHGGSPGNDLYERHAKYKREIWTERTRDSGWFGNRTNGFDTEESINDPDNLVQFGRSHYWKSEVLNWTEDESIISRHRDDRFFGAEATSFSFKRNSRHKLFDAKHGFDRVEKLIDDGQVERHRYKLINQGNRGNRFDRSSNVVCRGNYEQTLQRCENSVDSHMVVGKTKVRLGKLRSKPCITLFVYMSASFILKNISFFFNATPLHVSSRDIGYCLSKKNQNENNSLNKSNMCNFFLFYRNSNLSLIIAFFFLNVRLV